MTRKEEWSITELATDIKTTLQSDKDFIIITDGETGSGKSTFSIKLAKKACPWFSIKTDIIYGRDELVEKITTAKNGSAFVCDEAINLLFKRDFMTKKQKFILRLLDMCRDKNLCLIMCVPNFWSLDKHILEGRVKLRCHISKTGFCFLWKPTTNPFTPDKWCRKYNEKVCYNWDAYPSARRTKGFLGYTRFGDLGNEEKNIYLAIKKFKKEEVKRKEENEEKKEQIERRKGIDYGENDVLLFLREKGLLKNGALTAYATLKQLDATAISHRLKTHQQIKHKEDAVELKVLKEVPLYNNTREPPKI